MLNFCVGDKDCMDYMKTCTFNPEFMGDATPDDYMDRFSDCRKWWKDQESEKEKQRLEKKRRKFYGRQNLKSKQEARSNIFRR